MQPAALLQCIVVYLVALAPNLRHVIDRQIFLLLEENKKDTMGPSTKKPSFTVRTIAKIPMPIRMCDSHTDTSNRKSKYGFLCQNTSANNMEKQLPGYNFIGIFL